MKETKLLAKDEQESNYDQIVERVGVVLAGTKFLFAVGVLLAIAFHWM